jgi:trimethylamine--corrinoid protein Co-methyltransferase
MPRSLFLPAHKAEKIHEASVRVLANTGVKLDHEGAEALFLDAGAKKDTEGRILIPGNLIDEALEKIQPHRRIHLYDRDGKESIVSRIGKTYFGPGADALYNIDPITLELRRSRLTDIRNNVRIADALPGFEFIMSMALPDDVKINKLYATVFFEMAKNTTKPLVATSTCLEDIKHIHNIASIVAGGKEQLRKKPFFIAYLDPISPLIMDRANTDMLLYCAENDIPILYAAGANCGSGAPITPEGGVVQGSAECLAGLTLALLKNGNIQFIYGANTSAMDMRSTIVSYGDPIWFKTTAMYSDMGLYYNLPSWGAAGSSDSFSIDAQAAMEAYEGISLILMSSSTLVHDVGFLAHGELYDARMLILTDMMIERATHMLKHADLSENALAVDVINEVARNGDLYLAHPHTAENFRHVLWIPPDYINRRRITEARHGELPELLTEKVNNILNTHEPKELPQNKINEITDYISNIR